MGAPHTLSTHTRGYGRGTQEGSTSQNEPFLPWWLRYTPWASAWPKALSFDWRSRSDLIWSLPLQTVELTATVMMTVTVNAVQNLIAYLSKYRTQSLELSWQCISCHFFILHVLYGSWDLMLNWKVVSFIAILGAISFTSFCTWILVFLASMQLQQHKVNLPNMPNFYM